MSDWYAIRLGDALLAQPRLAELETDLSVLYEQAGRPSDMTAYYRHESGDLQCHLTVYLTAGFQAKAKWPEAEPCAPPDGEGLGFLAGFNAGQ